MRTRHWGTWVFANLMAIVPLITWYVTQLMMGHRMPIRTEATRELLFYALSASSIALVATHEAAESTWTRAVAFLALFLTIGSAIVYGEFLIGEALRAAVTLLPAYHLSIGLAVATFLVSAIAEALIRWRGRP